MEAKPKWLNDDFHEERTLDSCGTVNWKSKHDGTAHRRIKIEKCSKCKEDKPCLTLIHRNNSSGTNGPNCQACINIFFEFSQLTPKENLQVEEAKLSITLNELNEMKTAKEEKKKVKKSQQKRIKQLENLIATTDAITETATITTVTNAL